MASGANRLRKAMQQNGSKSYQYRTRGPEKKTRSGTQGKARHPGYSGGKSVQSGSLRRYLKQVRAGI